MHLIREFAYQVVLAGQVSKDLVGVLALFLSAASISSLWFVVVSLLRRTHRASHARNSENYHTHAGIERGLEWGAGRECNPVFCAA
jgi:hypothetical protein